MNDSNSALDIEEGSFTRFEDNRRVNFVSSFESLKNKCSKREKAHKACRDRNKKYNNIIKGIVILSSAFATYITNFNEEMSNEDNSISTINKISTFATTIFAGFDAYFNNGKESEIHHQISRDYGNLKHDISGYLRITDSDELSRSTYSEFHTRYTTLHSNSTSLFSDIRKKYEL
jgi:hypothetical protein